MCTFLATPQLFFQIGNCLLCTGRADAMAVGINDLPNCMAPPGSVQQRERIVFTAALSVEAQGEQEQRVALRNLDSVIRRMSVLPGQRVIVMVSPDFYVAPTTPEQNDLIDRATKVGAVVNTLAAHGLYTSSLYDAASREHVDSVTTQFRQNEESIQQDVLAVIADGTGGQFFHNRNDLDQGFIRLGAQSEVSYVLGFSPRDLKLDQTQVFKTVNQARLSVVARIDTTAEIPSCRRPQSR
jgi:VWFA-related protein